ncbi:AMP-binding protein [Variovorax sp. 770b2]|uniref:AMP-binding protein n=1 Tax=Variovorax sp. 770b2 TaxID=1566271 RepID=UPI0008E375DE|nr:AMP-binding protein [Variovorax sp. 770b2]SFP92337.1 Long-chain acyl-CoA synthetase (AMP-forming) [Variovorax sp. 770b2]
MTTSTDTLLHRLLHWERTMPETVYLTQPLADGRTVDYTWRQVADEARRIAHYLQTLALPPRSHIALLGRNSAHWLIADLAIWMAGHVTIPLYCTLSAANARYVFEHSESRLLFLGKMDGTSDNWTELQHALPIGLPVVGLPMSPLPHDNPVMQWHDLLAMHAPLADIALPSRDALATILYTSGSTGQPKGVMHSYGSMIDIAQVSDALFSITPEDRMLSYLPLAHAAERSLVEATSLYFGCRVFFANNLETFQQDLRRARPTLFFSVPRLWVRFRQGVCEKIPPWLQKLAFALPVASTRLRRKILVALGLDQVRVAFSGSAPLSPEVLVWYRSLGLDLLEGYGMSENFAISHINPPGKVRIGTVGLPEPGVQCRIGEDSEIQVRGPGQMLGYYKMPEATAQTLPPDGFLRTGDQGVIDADGYLRIVGRVKDMFKTGKGRYVAPVPIENALGNHPLVDTVCVAGLGLPRPFALVMLSPQGQAESRDSVKRELHQLMDTTNAALEEHERLGCLIVVREPWSIENGLLTPTLKIRRSVIEARYMPLAEGWQQGGQAVLWE